MLWLALYFPALALESVGFDAPAGQACALYLPGGRQAVLAMNSTARGLGITEGMALTSALAIAPNLLAKAHDQRSIRTTLHRLMLWSQQFTSMVSHEGDDGLLLEVGASLTLFKGLKSLQQSISSQLEALGYSASQGVAPSPSAAWLLAQTDGHICATDNSQVESLVTALPLSLLRLPARQLDLLQGMGLRRIGDCLHLPRAGLSQRLGPEFLLTLDKILGRAPDPRQIAVVPPTFQVQALLPDVVHSTTPLLFLLQRLLRELSGFLRAYDSGATRMRLGLIAPGQTIEYMTLNLLAPSRDADHLLKLWQEKLERHQLTHPVEGLMLEVPTWQPIEHGNLDLINTQDNAAPAFAHFLERLRNRLGEDAVQQWYCVAEHRPDYASRSQPWQMPTNKTIGKPRYPARPLWLLPAPQRLRQQGALPWLHGELELIHGPERIESGWWDGDDLRRDYYIARSRQQQTLWIFQQVQAPADWYLHGIFS